MNISDIRDKVITGTFSIKDGTKQPSNWEKYANDLELYIMRDENANDRAKEKIKSFIHERLKVIESTALHLPSESKMRFANESRIWELRDMLQEITTP